MNGEFLPNSSSTAFASSAVLVSAVDIDSGFRVTQRMLDMFKRKGEPDEHQDLYKYPTAALVDGKTVGTLLWFSETSNIA